MNTKNKKIVQYPFRKPRS